MSPMLWFAILATSLSLQMMRALQRFSGNSPTFLTVHKGSLENSQTQGMTRPLHGVYVSVRRTTTPRGELRKLRIIVHLCPIVSQELSVYWKADFMHFCCGQETKRVKTGHVKIDRALIRVHFRCGPLYKGIQQSYRKTKTGPSLLQKPAHQVVATLGWTTAQIGNCPQGAVQQTMEDGLGFGAARPWCSRTTGIMPWSNQLRS